jgi:hypothetical protein
LKPDISLATKNGHFNLLPTLQTLPEPDAGHRAGDRDRIADAGKRPIPRLLPGNDLCRLSAGANLDNGDPGTLLFSMTRFFKLLPGEQRQEFLGALSEKAS